MKNNSTETNFSPTKAMRTLIEESESQTKRISLIEQQFMDLCIRVNKIEDSNPQ